MPEWGKFFHPASQELGNETHADDKDGGGCCTAREGLQPLPLFFATCIPRNRFSRTFSLHFKHSSWAPFFSF